MQRSCRGGTIRGFFDRRLRQPLRAFDAWRRRAVRRMLAVAGAPLRAFALRKTTPTSPARVVRFVRVAHPDRIGHLALEIDSFLKERILAGDDGTVPILLYERERIANRALLDYWREHLATLEVTPELRESLPALVPGGFDGVPHLLHYVLGMDHSAPCYVIDARWGRRRPLLRLRDAHRQRGEAVLWELGMPQDAWFVCVHAREGGYSPADEHLHAYRNARIADYRLAMEEIVRRGGWCVRVGDATMEPLGAMRGVVDYAHSPLKSDWMDVFLCASCRFFLGNSSGLFVVASVFGRPAALANLAPMGCAFPQGANAIGIPKHVRRGDEIMPFRWVLQEDAGVMRDAEVFARRGLAHVDNTPDEVRDLAIEMLDRLDGRLSYDADDEARQARFRALFRPVHYSYGALSRVGGAFLHKHEHLL